MTATGTAGNRGDKAKGDCYVELTIDSGLKGCDIQYTADFDPELPQQEIKDLCQKILDHYQIMSA